mgnify:CR=1 FL=1
MDLGEWLSDWYGLVGLGFYLGALVVCLGVLWLTGRHHE